MTRAVSIASAVSSLLPLAGRNGPLVLFIGVMAGLVWTDLSVAAHPLMAGAVFAVNLGSFLQIDRSGFAFELARPLKLGGVLLWTLLGVPLVTWGVLQAVPLPVGLQAGVLLYALAPPAGSAAALAAMLGLNVQLALICRGIGSLIAPLVLPALCSLLLGRTLSLDPLAMARSLTVIVLGAGLAAWLLRVLAGKWTRHAEVSSGISVVGLLVVGVGSMQGMQTHGHLHSRELALTLVAAFAVAIGLQWLGTVVFAALGRHDAWTVGMVSGQRNVSLVWVALVPQPEASSPIAAFFAMSMVASFTLPLAMDLVLRCFPRPRGTRLQSLAEEKTQM